MNAPTILLIALTVAAGILTTAFTTIFCVTRHALRKRERQIFDAYVHDPREVEQWLIRGALDHLRQIIALEDPRR